MHPVPKGDTIKQHTAWHQVDYHHCCWWHHILLCQHTVVDADHCSSWTQIFGGKASEFRTAKVTLKVILKVTDNGVFVRLRMISY